MENNEIFFRGRSLSARKYDSDVGSHLYSEDVALEKALSLSEGIGVTRLADVTGFDRIGIPVYNSIKPAVNGSCCQHGKGLTRKASKISALMESFERHFALETLVPSFVDTYDHVKDQYPVIPLDRMLLARSNLFHETLPIHWALGWDIMNNCETAAPLATVELAGKRTLSRDYSTGHFQVSSNGYASGFHLLEALSQGLIEVVERDAITCNNFQSYAGNRFFPVNLVNIDSIQSDIIQSLVEQFRSADIEPALFDCTVDTNIPTFNCYLFDKKNPSYMLTHGMGSSCNYLTAMSRAMTEAAQSRAVFNSGERDFAFREEYEILQMKSSSLLYGEFQSLKSTVDFSETEPIQHDTYEEIVAHCLDKLRNVGIKQCLVFQMTPEDMEIVVAKVIIPGMEGILLSSSQPGTRAKSYYQKGLT